MTDTATLAPERRNPFHPELVNFQIAWDSTSLGLLKECARKYYYEIICGWRSKHQSIHLTFGLLYHAGLEAYDHFAASIGKLDGDLTDDEHQEGIRQCLRRVLREGGQLVQPPCPACNGVGQVQLEAHPDHTATWETCELCKGTRFYGPAKWETWKSDDPYKNMWTLVRSLVWYLDAFRNSPLRTVTLSNGKPAVELSFLFAAGEINGIEYSYCGHFDRLAADRREANPQKSVHDRKTTKSQINSGYWQGFNPHNQFSLYTAASAMHFSSPAWGVTVDAAQVLVNSTRFERQFIAYPPQLVNEWLTEARTWIAHAQQYAEENNWPKNDKSCGNYGGCAFRKVCSKSPEYRQSWLEADFIVRKWNPLETRGDI